MFNARTALKSGLLRRVRDSDFFARVVSSRPYYTLHTLTDQLAVLLSKNLRPKGPKSTLIVCPTGGGNIGDQALLEATLQSISGDVRLLVAAEDALEVPSSDRDRVSVVVASGYNYLPAVFRLFAVIRVNRIIQTSVAVVVVGADLMDGAYNPVGSLGRSSALWLAAKAKLPAVLVGCSWADNHVSTCYDNLVRASEAGAVVNVRDPLSLQRLQSEGLMQARLTADIVFAFESADGHGRELADRAPHTGHSMAIVNASGLVGNKIEQTGHYVHIVRDLLDRGFSVVLLPHVFRNTGDDLSACRAIAEEFDTDEVKLVVVMLSPTEVRTLCEKAALVVTGRMHLAVIAMSVGKPTVTLGTHGKVEGMYGHFNLLGLCVDPYSGDLGANVVKAVTGALSNKGLSRHIVEKMPAVRELARHNLSPLRVEVADGLR